MWNKNLPEVIASLIYEFFQNHGEYYDMECTAGSDSYASQIQRIIGSHPITEIVRVQNVLDHFSSCDLGNIINNIIGAFIAAGEDLLAKEISPEAFSTNTLIIPGCLGNGGEYYKIVSYDPHVYDPTNDHCPVKIYKEMCGFLNNGFQQRNIPLRLVEYNKED